MKAYHNHLCAAENAKRDNTEQAHQEAAHHEAFDAVVEFILEYVIDDNGVVALSSLRLIYTKKLDECGHL